MCHYNITVHEDSVQGIMLLLHVSFETGKVFLMTSHNVVTNVHEAVTPSCVINTCRIRDCSQHISTRMRGSGHVSTGIQCHIRTHIFTIFKLTYCIHSIKHTVHLRKILIKHSSLRMTKWWHNLDLCSLTFPPVSSTGWKQQICYLQVTFKRLLYMAI